MGQKDKSLAQKSSLWKGLGYGLLIARYSLPPNIHAHTRQILILYMTIFVTLGGLIR